MGVSAGEGMGLGETVVLPEGGGNDHRGEAGSAVASKQLGHSSDAVTLKHYIERANAAPDSTVVLDRFRAGARLLHAFDPTGTDSPIPDTTITGERNPD